MMMTSKPMSSIPSVPIINPYKSPMVSLALLSMKKEAFVAPCLGMFGRSQESIMNSIMLSGKE